VRTLIESCRRAVLNASDTVCLERARLATEGYQMFADDPVPVRRAKTFEHILRHMTLDLETNPIFAGNTSSRPRAWMLLPEYSFDIPEQALIEDPRLKGHLDGGVIPAGIRAFWEGRSFGGAGGCGHLAVDNERVLTRGLNDVIAEAEQGTDEEHAGTYRRACAIACRAVIGWAHRYAEEAERRAGETADAARAGALRRVASACRHVPAEPARNLFEALQAVVLVHLAIHIEGHGYSVSPGRVDQFLAPYDGDDADAAELLAAFLLKLTANSLWGSHSKTQPITIGGSDEHGRDQCNGVTMRALEACEIARVPDPSLFLRWHRGMPERIKRKAVAMLASGLSFPLLISDEQTIAGLAGAGIAPADAANYCVIGCNELGIPAKLMWEAVPFLEVDILNRVLDQPDINAVADADGLLGRLETEAERDLDDKIRRQPRHKRRAAETVPTPFTSALMDGCLAQGTDLYERLPYPHLNIRSSGFVNLVNALSAVHTVVFRDKKATLAKLRDALHGDFGAAAELREELLRAPKWGDDDDRADRWALDWVRRRDAVLRRLEQSSDCPPLLMEMVVRSLHHLEGRRLGATPDGRRAGEPLADSIGAELGTATAGPTATLNSVCKMHTVTYWPGGYNLNLTLPAGLLSGPDMNGKITALVDVFFAHGGQELQINCLDADTLRDAQAHPEKHPDLLVRVAGFNALFAKLSAAEQDELIRRVEAAER